MFFMCEHSVHLYKNSNKNSILILLHKFTLIYGVLGFWGFGVFGFQGVSRGFKGFQEVSRGFKGF